MVPVIATQSVLPKEDRLDLPALLCQAVYGEQDAGPWSVRDHQTGYAASGPTRRYGNHIFNDNGQHAVRVVDMVCCNQSRMAAWLLSSAQRQHEQADDQGDRAPRHVVVEGVAQPG